MRRHLRHDRVTHIRLVKMINGHVAQYHAIKGVEWSSGYDERVVDELDNRRLSHGLYMVTFIPVGAMSGSDAIKHLRVKKL